MKCFLAAHGTGKTTLANEIKKRRKDIYVTDAFSRPIKKAASRISISELQSQYLNFELMRWAQNNYYDQNVLTTRSLFDSIIFARLLTPALDILDEIIDEVKENKDRIEKIFYLPIEFEMENDGIRYDQDFQKKYDEQIHYLIQEFELYEQIILIKGPLEVRVEQILTHL